MESIALKVDNPKHTNNVISLVKYILWHAFKWIDSNNHVFITTYLKCMNITSSISFSDYFTPVPAPAAHTHTARKSYTRFVASPC